MITKSHKTAGICRIKTGGNKGGEDRKRADNEKEMGKQNKNHLT